MGRRYRRYRRWEKLPIFMVAFGLGLFLALTASIKLALLMAAVALIYVGIAIYYC